METDESNDGLAKNGDFDSEFPIPEESVSYEGIEDELIEDEEENSRLLKKLGIQTDGVVKFIVDWLRGRRG